ncbi:MAG: hypothetical protein WAX69_25735 [Victivallales bacterium]
MKRTMSDSVMKMRTLIQEATLDQFKRKQCLSKGRKAGRPPLWINWRNLCFLTVFSVAACSVFPYFSSSMKNASKTRNEISFEAYAGGKMADIAAQKAGHGEVKTIVSLISRCNGKYLARIESLRDKLIAGGSPVNMCWAADDEGYSFEDDSDGQIDRILSSYPETRSLIILSTGRIVGKRYSDKLEKFIEGGGSLVMISDGERASSLKNLALNGKSVMIVGKYSQQRDGIWTSGFAEVFNSKFEVLSL